MTEVRAALLAGLQAMSAWEALAVLLAVLYLVLAIRQNPWCWAAALGSACIYGFIMFDARLYMQSVLQGFYLLMACYGWWCWRRGEAQAGLPVVSWVARDHIGPLLVILCVALLCGALLDRHTDAAAPYLDALAASGAIVTTWMVAHKVLQNWHYWFVIDLGSAWLYASQGLWLTALLFVAYLGLIVIGYRSWRASMPAYG